MEQLENHGKNLGPLRSSGGKEIGKDPTENHPRVHPSMGTWGKLVRGREGKPQRDRIQIAELIDAHNPRW